MFSNLSEQERADRDAIITAIRDAFADVTRGELGISWSECVEIDNYEPEEVCAAARLADTDSHWSELVDRADWEPFPGIGGFSFINTEGFRYYLPPTMIRFLRGDNTEWFPGHLLGSINRFTEQHVLPLWSEAQLRSISRFIAFMAAHDDEVCLNSEEANPWRDALEHRWHAYLLKLTS